MNPNRFRAIVAPMAIVAVGALSIDGARATNVSSVNDVNPDSSTLDATDPDGASGGRVNGLGAVAFDNDVFYAATEWGGLYKTVDQGRHWLRLPRHLPNVTWDVEVDHDDPDKVYATSFYDG